MARDALGPADGTVTELHCTRAGPGRVDEDFVRRWLPAARRVEASVQRLVDLGHDGAVEG